jgi:hypothetical protein
MTREVKRGPARIFVRLSAIYDRSPKPDIHLGFNRGHDGNCPANLLFPCACGDSRVLGRFCERLRELALLKTQDAAYDDLALAANESVLVFSAINIIMARCGDDGLGGSGGRGMHG